MAWCVWQVGGMKPQAFVGLAIEGQSKPLFARSLCRFHVLGRALHCLALRFAGIGRAAFGVQQAIECRGLLSHLESLFAFRKYEVWTLGLKLSSHSRPVVARTSINLKAV